MRLPLSFTKWWQGNGDKPNNTNEIIVYIQELSVCTSDAKIKIKNCKKLASTEKYMYAC